MAAPRLRPVTDQQKLKVALLGIQVGERVELTCPVCGKKFSRTYCWVQQSRTLACSHKCAAVISVKKGPHSVRDRGSTEVVCGTCGKSFLRNNAALHKINFCSTKCAGAARRGVNSPAWKGGPVTYGGPAQKLMRERKKAVGHCERCGSKKRLQSHHVLPVVEHPHLAADPSNIIVLCAKCHGDEHPHVRTALAKERVVYTGVQIKCVICGKPRYVMPSVLALGKAQCCSNSCKMVLRAQRKRQFISSA